jgi:hypothetical protein
LPTTLNEIYRVLKKGGRLILLGEPSQGLMGGKERLQVNLDCDHGINELRYSIKEWKTAFRQTGFKSKIFLPANFDQILQSKGGIYKLIGNLLDIMPPAVKKLSLLSVKMIIFKIFDGFFNSISYKEK